MKEVMLDGHMVRIYDSIDELPVTRFHRYNRFLLVDAGIGSDIADFDGHLERVVAYMRKGDNDSAAKEMENLRQNVFMILEGQSVRDLSFACLVESIDGKACDDLSQEGLMKVLAMLGGTPRKDMTASFEEVKKKIDGELSLYFPRLFDDVRTKEYYDILKRLTVERLTMIGEEDEGRQDAVRKLREQVVLFAKPRVYTGADGLEVRHDKDFETMCLVITENTGVEAKQMSVLEYYNAYEYVRKKAKEAGRRASDGVSLRGR